MELTYETEEIRDYFRVPAKALDCYGPIVARGLAVRFADLRALQRASELPALGASECTFGEFSAMKVPVAGDYYILLVASHPKKKSQPLNWVTVTRVKVIKIGRQDEQG